MKSLGSRILLLVAGGSVILAIVLAAIAQMSYSVYYTEVMANRAGNFAERILSVSPDFWEQYQRVPGQFSERMQSLILYEPNTGLYVIDLEGRVLASSGEGKIFWGNYRVNMTALKAAARGSSGQAVFGSDPDVIDGGCIIAARPIMHQQVQTAWLYVVARNADITAELPQLIQGYAVRGAIKIALVTLAIGLLISVGVLTLLARPLAALTLAAEQIKPDQVVAQNLSNRRLPFIDRNDEIGRLARSFDAMVTRLQESAARILRADQGRRQMIASVSHDLRTPLTALTSQIETLKLKAHSLSAADQTRYLVGALNNAQHLKRLTDSLADLARLDDPDLTVHLEPTALGDLIDDVVQRNKARAESQNVALTADYINGLAFANVDIQLIERALGNLIDNALRVMPEGGSIQVKLAETQDGLRLTVQDDGPGITKSDQERVFEPFFQTSEHRAHRGASGLGLAIVKRVAQLHGAKLGIDSLVGSGTQIWFELPKHQSK